MLSIENKRHEILYVRIGKRNMKFLESERKRMKCSRAELVDMMVTILRTSDRAKPSKR